MSFVLDASVAMHWYFGDGAPKDLAYATRVLEAMRTTGVVAPAIWVLEVANMLARAEAKGLGSEARSDAFVDALRRMDITVEDTVSVDRLGHTLQIARRHGLSAYDACYLDLAMRSALPLATLDDALAKAARKAGVSRFAAR